MKKTEDLKNYLVRVLHSSLKPPSTDFDWQAKECQNDVNDVSVPKLKTQPLCKLVTLMYGNHYPTFKKIPQAYLHQHYPSSRHQEALPSLAPPSPSCPISGLSFLIFSNLFSSTEPLTILMLCGYTCCSLCLEYSPPAST